MNMQLVIPLFAALLLMWITPLEGQKLYPFRKGRNFSVADDDTMRVYVCHPFPYRDRLASNFFVGTNGYVALDTDFRDWRSNKMGEAFPNNTVIIAPFWTDFHINRTVVPNGNRIYYSEYVRNQNGDIPFLQNITADIRGYLGQNSNFTAKYAFLTTWYHVTPYPWTKYYQNDSTATFQLLLTTNSVDSYAMFIYPANGMKNLKTGNRKVMVGYSLSARSDPKWQKSLNLVSKTRTEYPYEFDSLPGNTGKKGTWLFKLPTIDRNDYKKNTSFAVSKTLMYPYKTARVVVNSDDVSFEIPLCSPMPYYGRLAKKIYVCTNGFVSFDETHCSWRPQKMGTAFPKGHAMIATFWSDLDLGNSTFPGGNRMFYKVYEKSRFSNAETIDVLTRVCRDVRNYTSSKDFEATWALVVTWYKATPYPATKYWNTNQTVTFQMILATDGMKTFVINIFKEMRFTDPSINVMIGFTFFSQPERSMTLKSNKTGFPFAYESMPGNTGYNGIWIIEVPLKARPGNTLNFGKHGTENVTVSSVIHQIRTIVQYKTVNVYATLSEGGQNQTAIAGSMSPSMSQDSLINSITITATAAANSNVDLSSAGPNSNSYLIASTPSSVRPPDLASAMETFSYQSSITNNNIQSLSGSHTESLSSLPTASMLASSLTTTPEDKTTHTNSASIKNMVTTAAGNEKSTNLNNGHQTSALQIGSSLSMHGSVSSKAKSSPFVLAKTSTSSLKASSMSGKESTSITGKISATTSRAAPLPTVVGKGNQNANNTGQGTKVVNVRDPTVIISTVSICVLVLTAMLCCVGALVRRRQKKSLQVTKDERSTTDLIN